MTNNPRIRFGWSLVSLLGLGCLWFVIAAIAKSPVLPGPVAVWQAFLRDADGPYWWHMGATLARVVVSFGLAMAVGTVIGLAMGRSAVLDRLFGGWLILFLNLPALVTVILCYVWFGLGETAAITAVAINKIPNVAVTIREGARAISRDLDEMAGVFQLGWGARMRHIVAPQLAPFMAVAARNGLALVWKIVLVVELIGRSSGVGFQLNLYFQLFDVAAIIAYALGFIVIVQVIELGVLEPWERYANRWRR